MTAKNGSIGGECGARVSGGFADGVNVVRGVAECCEGGGGGGGDACEGGGGEV